MHLTSYFLKCAKHQSESLNVNAIYGDHGVGKSSSSIYTQLFICDNLFD